MSSHQRRKDDRPDEIIEAAFTSFAEKGYADTKMDQVAKQAGVSKGLVFLYFKTKEELFKAVVRRVVVPRVQAFDSRIASDVGSVSEFLRGPFVEFASQLLNSPVRYIIRLLIAEGPKHPDLTAFYHQEVVSRGMAMVSALIQKGVEQGEFRNTELTRYPQLVVAPVIMSMVWKTLFERHQKLDVRPMLETHIDLLLKAIAKPQANLHTVKS